MFTREKAAACATIRLRKGVPNRDLARAILKTAWKTEEEGCYGLVYVQGEWHEWGEGRWRAYSDQRMEDYLRTVLGDRVMVSSKDEEGVVSLQPISVGQRRVNDVLRELRSLVGVDASRPVPGWLPGTPRLLASCEPEDCITFPNGILHVPSDQFISPVPPWWFHQASLSFAYEREPSCGTTHWDTFIASLGAPFAEQLDCLYEMMGLLLVPDTSYQTIFWLLGPPRSGKGTLVRVIERLVGRENVCYPSLSAYGERHGIQDLIGKSLAVSADIRLEGPHDQDRAMSHILSISGGDDINIQRKYLPDWSGRLNTRLLFVANAFPNLTDATRALRSRSLVLQTFHTVEEKFRDPDLSAKLLSELPAILHIALAGLRRLKERRRFLQPACGETYRREMEELANPLRVFVDDCCELIPDAFETTVRLYDRYRDWCINEVGMKPGHRVWFCRDLKSTLIGDIRAHRPTTPDASGVRQPGYKGIAIKA